MSVIPFEQVLKEIEALQMKSPEGCSVAEMAEATGRSYNWCREQIRLMIAAGKMRYNGKKSVAAIDGRFVLVPVYLLVDEKKTAS